MRKRKLYGVYDTRESELCIYWGNMTNIAEFLGVKEKTIRRAIWANVLIKRRYLVSRWEE